MGGEEFAWLLPEADAEGARAAAERGRRAVSDTLVEPVGRVSMSAGVSELAPDGDVTALYQRADRALYRAKRTGRDRTVVADAVVAGG